MIKKFNNFDKKLNEMLKVDEVSNLKDTLIKCENCGHIGTGFEFRKLHLDYLKCPNCGSERVTYYKKPLRNEEIKDIKVFSISDIMSLFPTNDEIVKASDSFIDFSHEEWIFVSGADWIKEELEKRLNEKILKK